MTDRCFGPIQDPDCGDLVCRRNPWVEPEDGDWERFCEECQREREHHLELVGDYARDGACLDT